MSRTTRLFFIISMMVGILCALGCSASDIKNVFATPSSRVELLHEAVTKYTQALYWGAPDEAARFVAPENMGKFFADYKSVRKNEKLVDSQIEGIQELPDGNMQVSVAFRYYRIPTYLIESRIEDQVWEFRRVTGGWVYLDRTVRKGEDS